MFKDKIYPDEKENDSTTWFSEEITISLEGHDNSMKKSTTSNNLKAFIENSKKPIYLPSLITNNNILSIKDIFNNYNIKSNDESEEEPDIYFNLNINEKNKKNTKKIPFKIIYPKPLTLFTYSKERIIEDEDFKFFLGKKKIRSAKRSKRGRYRDNLRKMFFTQFLNTALIRCLNENLEKENYQMEFKKFPRSFVEGMTKEKTKKILQMNLLRIYETKDLYKNEDINKYENNLKIVNTIKNDKNYVFQKILDMKFSELLEEYSTSDEFENDCNLRRIKNSISDIDFKKYVFIGKSFKKFYWN